MSTKWLFRLLSFGVFGVLTVADVFFFRKNLPVFLGVLGVIFIEAILLLVLYRRLVKPHMAMLIGMDLIREQDFSSRLRRSKSRETNRIIDTFNRMIAEQRKERVVAQEKNHFLELLLEASAQGVIILNFDEQISSINRVGAQLLGVENSADIIGKTFAQINTEFAAVLSSLQQGNEQVVRTFGHSLYRCMRSSFVDRGFSRPFILIEEMTHELMRIEKESYERIIRMMAHEVNNSMSGISVTLGVVAEVLEKSNLPETADVLQAVQASSERSRRMAAFIANLAAVVRIPLPTLSEVSLSKLLRSVDAFSRIECRNRNIDLVLSLPQNDITLRADGIQMEQALNNIVKNAYESIGQNGEIKISVTENPLTISVADNGPGISPSVREKLFTPFFTTKSTGQGVGLTLIREVLLNHHFRFSLSTSEGWTTFSIYCQAENSKFA
ncbi:MAG: PAS domain-containing protein [Prevotellaceae bacterium]|jgi:nitrogen fixation/metabolism regulation signal transduction histidine kinase|nr:PAS domain-containing protein [Prevotellaceae bacterium]